MTVISTQVCRLVSTQTIASLSAEQRCTRAVEMPTHYPCIVYVDRCKSSGGRCVVRARPHQA